MKKKARPQTPVVQQSKPDEQEGFNLSIESTWALIIFVFSTLLYANTIGHGYALDDVAVIEQNKFVQQGIAGIPSILTTFYWQGFWNLNAGLYRPLSLVMFAIEQTLFPNSPFINHFVNILLFAGSVVLLFKALLRLFGNNAGTLAVVASLLFAAHPIHTEVVANIKSCDELLALFMLLSSCTLLLKFIQSNNKWHLAAAVLTYALALLSKESSVAFMGIYAMLLFYKKQSIKQSLIALAPFALAAVLFFGIHHAVIANGPARVGYTYRDNSLLAASSFAERIATALFMQGKYLWLMAFPHPLSYDYSFQQIPLYGFTSWQVWASIILIIALLYAGIKGLLNKTIIGFGITWYAITMFITSNLFFVIGATMAERFLFIPSVGLCMAGAYLFVKYLAKAIDKLDSPLAMMKQSAMLSVLLLIVLTLYSFKTVSRNMDWKNSNALFLADISTSPNSYNVNYNYGTVYLSHKAVQEQDASRRQEYLSEAVKAFERAVQIDTLASDAFINLSSAYYQQGRYADAFIAVKKALRVDTVHVSLYNNAGNYAYRLKSYDEGLFYLQRAINKGLADEGTYKFIAATYFEKKDYPAAIAAYNKALSINPNNFENLVNTANIYAVTGNYTEAASLLRRALLLQPLDKNAQTTLLRIFAESNQHDSLQYYSQLFGIR